MIWFYTDIWENVSNLKSKYNWFVFKFFELSPFEVSCWNTYRIAIMWSKEGKVFSRVYKESVATEILHIAFFSSSNSTFFCLFSLQTFKSQNGSLLVLNNHNLNVK